MERKEFEELLSDVLPLVWAMQESLEKRGASGTIDIRANKDGYINISYADAEYLQFHQDEGGKVRFSWPFKV